MGIDHQEIDFEGRWDSSLSDGENWEVIKERIEEIAPNSDEVKAKNGELEEDEQKAEENIKKREIEHLQDIREQKIEEIRKRKNPKIDQHYEHLHNYIDTITGENQLHNFVLIGQQGIGKTRQVIQKLAESDRDWIRIGGNVTPLELYKKLYRNNEKTIVLDDVLSIFSNKRCLALLYQAMETSGVREVEWSSSSNKLDEAPEKFEFAGNLIIIMNEIPDNTKVRVMLSRAITYEIDMSYGKMLELMNELAKTLTDDLTREENEEVIDHLKGVTNKNSRNFNLRTFMKAREIYKAHDTGNWRALVNQLKEVKQG